MPFTPIGICYGHIEIGNHLFSTLLLLALGSSMIMFNSTITTLWRQSHNGKWDAAFLGQGGLTFQPCCENKQKQKPSLWHDNKVLHLTWPSTQGRYLSPVRTPEAKFTPQVYVSKSGEIYNVPPLNSKATSAVLSKGTTLLKCRIAAPVVARVGGGSAPPAFSLIQG